MEYATNMAIVENGIVTNIIWGMTYTEIPNAVPCDGLLVHIGDTYSDGTFFHDGNPVREIGEVINEQSEAIITVLGEESTENAVQIAHKIRPIIEQAASALDDKDASKAPEMFPRLKQDGALVTHGTRICWNGQVKRAAVDLYDIETNDPDNAPTLWEDINYIDGYRVIPEVITAGTAFSANELGWYHDDLYKSLIDANVWTPAAYPEGWEHVLL